VEPPVRTAACYFAVESDWTNFVYYDELYIRFRSVNVP
jgi:hypothetical protein